MEHPVGDRFHKHEEERKRQEAYPAGFRGLQVFQYGGFEDTCDDGPCQCDQLEAADQVVMKRKRNRKVFLK
jgi:hypothetical protein